ncbi:MAG: MogA/MoaB family molybdenum cofactor biosynthesis protein [Chloroflexi bacterium]|nr:MogA/MoaB family molybdenum cofactor biosynthesis protein [Chloroflexota bacterium]
MTFRDHEQAAAAARAAVRCAVVTLSDSRTEETDTSGQLILDALRAAGHEIVERHVIPDEPALLGPLLDRLCAEERVEAILLTGGTGVGPRDSTHDVVAARLDKRLDGFGELFRMLSWEEIGPAAMLSRALGGVRYGRVLLSMPGSRKAVQLAMEKLVLPELRHLVWEATGRD